ncbi:MAG TPA: DUF1015 domain-containing protein, partial [Burkholderiaceae bacterium]|nr:DUF1015 domain-containing protein [Burkholderiaceae bacterium]
RLPHLLLPRPGIDLRKWAVIACDQHTAEPDYWQQVAREVGDAPSTLHLIFPEVYLGAADSDARIARIQQAMRRYLADGLFVEHVGPVLVERTVGGRTRRGLMLELDLERYDYGAASSSLIRPTEGTMVARLAPRIAVRRGAPLELPHILVLIDDPQCTVIEPPAARRSALRTLYQTDLMYGGGHVAGHALDATLGAQVVRALQELADPRAFAARYGVPSTTPVMLFAMGDGNHSLATAKAIWDEAKARVGMDHPSRWALVEVVNIHDPALDFAAIHRLLFGVTGNVRQALAQAFGARVTCTDVPSAAAMRARVTAAAGGARLTAGLIGPGARFSVVEIAEPPSTLAVATWQPFIDGLIERGLAREVDYVHGDDALERLAQQPGHVGVHLPAIGKSELMRRVVHDGPTPRKTFSMGEAHEKRFYIEARRIA